jgi:DNA repair exonuclease SbcCD nuclease subunit
MFDQIIALAPDLIVIGGDLFDKVRPSNHAVVFAVEQFARLKRELPNTITVLAAGNHEVKSSVTGSVLPVLSHVGVHVADRHAERFYFSERNLAVLAIPDSPGNVRPAITPDPRARYNVAVIHGELEGMPRKGPTPENEITTEALGASRWTYVALGHQHVYREMAPNVFYSGATDYTSSDIWGERREEIALGIPGKGFIERDLETGAHTFHPIAGVRAVFDLSAIDATGLTPDEIIARIESSVAECPDGAIVRLVVNEIPRDIGRAIGEKAIRRTAERRLFLLRLVLRRPDPMARIREVTTERKKEIESVVQRTRRHANERELPPDVDRGEFVAGMMRYVGEAGEKGTSIIEQQTSESLSLPLERAS